MAYTGYFRSKQYKWAECYIYVEWTSRDSGEPGFSYLDIDVDVQCMRLHCIAAPAYIEVRSTSGYLIQGGRYDFTAPPYNKGSGFSRVDMGFHTFKVPHQEDGTMTVDVKVYWRCNLTDGYSGVFIPELYANGRVNCVPVGPEKPDPPGPPINIQASGLFESDQNIYLNWQKGSGEVTKYSLFYDIRKYNPSTHELSWIGETYIETIFPSNSYTFRVPDMRQDKFKYAYQIAFKIVAINDGGSSEAWTNASNYITHYGIRVINDNFGINFGKSYSWTGGGWANLTGRYTPSGNNDWETLH